MTIRSVGFIGVGNMGAGMARCVRDAGFDLLVCDTNPAALERFEREGVRTTSRAADCAGMDAVIVLVANDAQILSVTLGPDGIARAVKKGQEPLICLMSTTLPETVAKVAKGLSAFGMRMVDAPVSGGQVRAEDGTLTIMIAGADADIDRAEPLMRSMGSDVFRCGALGAAEVVKLVNNMLGIASMYLAAEAFDLAASHGVSMERIIPILEVSSGRNFLTADASMAPKHYQTWTRSGPAFDALISILRKDLHLAQALARPVGRALPLLDEISRHVDATDDSVKTRWMRLAAQGDAPES